MFINLLKVKLIILVSFQNLANKNDLYIDFIYQNNCLKDFLINPFVFDVSDNYYFLLYDHYY